MDGTGLDISIDHRSAIPLYEQICQQIREKIENRQLKPGAPLPTTHQLRQRLQVNAKTAQQAMATLAREGYVTRQARRGTVVKGVPRRGVVGIYAHFDLLSDDGNHEYYRLITGYLSRQLDEHARVHRLYLGSLKPGVNAASEDLLRHLSGGTLCGALLVNSPPHLEELVRLGRESRTPVIALSGSGEVDYSVRVDHVGFVRHAADYLRENGCRKIGVIYNGSSLAFQDSAILKTILKDAGCPAKAAWIKGCTETEQGGYEAAQKLPLGDLDGLIVEDDVMAIGVDRFLCESHVRVPDDLQVATFWNRGSRLHLTLPFARFEMDTMRQARASLQLLNDSIKGLRIAEPHVKIVPERVVVDEKM